MKHNSMEIAYPLHQHPLHSMMENTLFLTVETQKIIRETTTKALKELRHFLFIVGERGTGKSTLLLLVQRHLQEQYRTFFLPRPFASYDEYVRYLCRIAEVAYSPQLQEGELIRALQQQFKEPTCLLIDTFELMNRAQMQLSLNILRQTNLKIISAVRASDAKSQAMYQGQYVDHRVLFSCQTLSTSDIKRYLLFRIEKLPQTALASLPLDTLAKELKYYTKGYFHQLNLFVNALEKSHFPQKTTPKRLCRFMAHIAVENHLIDEKRYQKHRTAKKALYFVALLESFLEVALIAFLIVALVSFKPFSTQASMPPASLTQTQMTQDNAVFPSNITDTPHKKDHDILFLNVAFTTSPTK